MTHDARYKSIIIITKSPSPLLSNNFTQESPTIWGGSRILPEGGGSGVWGGVG